jgi:NAD+ dependent glucose-6-phosphate dehydrogenase
MKVMITGIVGTIGTIVADYIEKDHEVHGVDVRESDRPNTTQIDLADSADELAKTFEGVDVVLHFAADRRHEPWISWNELMRPNIIATANVYTAAHKAGVRRVVFASSMHAVGGYELIEPYASIINGNYEGIDRNKVELVKGLGQDAKPDSEYSASKVFGESLGKYFSEFEEMEGLVVRVGTVHPNNKPGTDSRSWVSYFSRNDIPGYFRACIEKKDVSYDILYGSSNNDWKVYDTPYAFNYLDFQPSDNAENHRSAPSAPDDAPGTIDWK